MAIFIAILWMLFRFVVLPALIILPITFWALWKMDAKEITNDYTINDLRSAPAECNASWDVLLSLGSYSEDGSAIDPNRDSGDTFSEQNVYYSIGLSEQDANMVCVIYETIDFENPEDIQQYLQTKDEEIKRIWEHASKGRRIIERLNGFAEIADLTEPDSVMEVHEPCYIENLKMLGQLYSLKTLSDYHNGEHRQAIETLSTFDSIPRKMMKNIRSSLEQIICLCLLHIDYDVANYFVNIPGITIEELEQLNSHFIPLTQEQYSIRNSLLFEYLELKLYVSDPGKYLKIKSPSRKEKKGFRYALKKNSTLRLFRAMTLGETEQIEKVWPSIYPDSLSVFADSNHKTLSRIYMYYNPMGGFYCELSLGHDQLRIMEKAKVKDRMFQLILKKRLNPEFDLKLIAQKENLTIDLEHKKIFCFIPNLRSPEEPEEVFLTINPEVLGLNMDE